MLGFFMVKVLWYCEFLFLVKYAVSQDSTDAIVLKFISQPKEITFAEHSNAKLPCVAFSSTPVTYTWTHNGTVLTLGSNTERYKLMGPDGNLTVLNVSLNDAGEYRCIASNSFGSGLSLKAVVRIAYLNAHNPIDNTITTTMYSSVKLSMNVVKSLPKPQFTWKKKRRKSSGYDTIVDGENGRLLIAQSGDLYIVGVRSEDAGAYRCIVTNTIAKKKIAFNFVLKVLEGAVDRQLSFVVSPSTTEATAGTGRVVLECIVGPGVESGSLQIPVIAWHKHDTELDPINDPKYSYPKGGMLRHKLIINDVQKNDSGWYTCIATTKSAVITSPRAQLIINHKPVLPLIQQGFPSVIQPFVGADVAIGSRASVGDVNWYKNAVNVLSLSRPSLSVLANGSLLLQNVSQADDGVYQAFVRTSIYEVSSPLVTLHVVERPPVKPTTLTSVTSVSTRSSSTEKTSSVSSASPPISQTATESHVTQQPPSSRFLYITSSPTSQSTIVTKPPSVSRFLYQKQTSAGLIILHGAENKGRMMLLYGTVAGGVVFLLLILLAVFCYKRQTRQRLRQGSMKLRTEPDEEEFEMKPVERRTTSPGKPISARRIRSSESKEDLIHSCRPNERRVSLNSNENHFIVSFEIEDHVSAHVNPALTSELAIIATPNQQTNDVIQEHPCPGSDFEEMRTLNERESDDLIDSGIEEEASDGLRKIPENREGEVKSIPVYATVKKSKNGNISCQEDQKALDKSTDEVLAGGQAAEPLYHVLEGPGDEPNDSVQGETGDERTQTKTASFYQSLMQCKQGMTEQKNQDNANGFSEEPVSSWSSIYQSLTPPNDDNLLNEESNITTDGLTQNVNEQKEFTSPPKGIYQPLIQSPSFLQNDRPRSVTGIYQPLSRNSAKSVPFVRCWSAPQEGNTSHATPASIRLINRQTDTEPIYQTVDDEERCPLSLDDSGSSLPQERRRTPRGSPLAQRRTIHEPLYIAVEVGSSRSNRRAFSSEYEPRYSPSPGRKNCSSLKPPTRRHRRNFSDGGHAFPVMGSSTGAESTSPVAERPAPSALPRHLGHRRNRSDIGLCPIDLSQDNQSRRETPISDSGHTGAEGRSASVERHALSQLPRHLGHRRNRSDIGLCPIDTSQENLSRRDTSISENGFPGEEGRSASVERRALSPLLHHLGHRRNRSDIGLCPIDTRQENLSRRLTSISDSGLPRTPSLGYLNTGEYSRSASDTTHCRVDIGP